MEARGQAGLWHKNNNLCLNDGSVDFWWFRSYDQRTQAECMGSNNSIDSSHSLTVHSALLSIYRTYNLTNLGPYGWRGKEKYFSHSSHSFSSASNSEQLQNAPEDLGPRALSAVL